MSDTRFSTKLTDTEDLIEVLDIDGLDDLQTMLMFLTDEPLTVRGDFDDLGNAQTIHVEAGHGKLTLEFPLTMLDISRQLHPAADTIDDTHHVAALQQALAGVRIYNANFCGEDDAE